MPAKTAKKTATKKTSDGFSAEERAAMKERAAELRAEGKKGAKQADGLQDLLDKIAAMAPDGSCARRASARDGDDHCTSADAEDLVRDARLRGRRRQGRRVLPGLGQVQLPVLDARLPGRGATSTMETCGPVAYALMKWSPQGGEDRSSSW